MQLKGFFVKNIKQARKGKGLSQKQLANLANLNDAVIVKRQLEGAMKSDSIYI